jgi:hypothetical protein
MANNLEDEMRAVVAQMGEQEDQQPQAEIQDIYVLIVREHEEVEDNWQVVDAVPLQRSPISPQLCEYKTLLIVLLCCLPTLLSILFQIYLLQNPPIATVTIIPKSQDISLSGALQLGRRLQPITISQSTTAPATGHGHQNAQVATGTVTLYNGQQSEQKVAQGTVLTGNDGVGVETIQSAIIPPGDPGTGYGAVTVPAQALQAGSKGNIRPGDINTSIGIAMFAKNSQFTGGQDERDFSTVSTLDIHRISTPLKMAVAQSMQGAWQATAKQHETILILPCSPTITPDHQPGDEAIQVKVAVSLSCSAIAYNSQMLQEKAEALLNDRARTELGTGYSLLGDIGVSVKRATAPTALPRFVLLSFKASGTWIYALSHSEQQHIRSLIAGKTRKEALRILVSLSGIAQASITWDDNTRLPKDSVFIHLVIRVLPGRVEP